MKGGGKVSPLNAECMLKTIIMGFSREVAPPLS